MTFLHFILLSNLHSPDVLSPHSLHPQSATEKGALLHRPADSTAYHPVCFWDVSSAVHEDDLPFGHDHAYSSTVRRYSRCLCLVFGECGKQDGYLLCHLFFFSETTCCLRSLKQNTWTSLILNTCEETTTLKTSTAIDMCI